MGGNAPLTAEVPPDVAQVAHQRGFGHLVSSRALASPMQRFALWLVIAIVCFGLLVAISSIRPNMFSFAYTVLRFIGLFFCFAGVYAIVVAIRSLVIGSRAYFVYANGFAYRHNRKVQAYAWPEITALQSVVGTRGDAAGKLVHYNLVTPAAPPIMIPVHIVNGRDEFLDHLIAALTRHGRPIT
jgi:hypothetical protein